MPLSPANSVYHLKFAFRLKNLHSASRRLVTHGESNASWYYHQLVAWTLKIIRFWIWKCRLLAAVWFTRESLKDMQHSWMSWLTTYESWLVLKIERDRDKRNKQTACWDCLIKNFVSWKIDENRWQITFRLTERWLGHNLRLVSEQWANHDDSFSLIDYRRHPQRLPTAELAIRMVWINWKNSRW